MVVDYLAEIVGNSLWRKSDKNWWLGSHLFLRPAADECLESYDRFVADMTNWRKKGLIKFRENHFDGLNQAPAIFYSLFNHNMIGKVLVSIDGDSA